MSQDRVKIYVTVNGRRHVFRVPPNISLETLLEKYRNDLGLPPGSVKALRASIIAPIDQPLASLGFREGTEIIVGTGSFGDEIEYLGPDG